MAKSKSNTQDNVVIIDPETDEVMTDSDKDTPNFKMYPIPTDKPGLGSKWCPVCNMKLGARSSSCSNCHHEFEATGKPAGKKSIHKCPDCREEIHHRAISCKSCGAHFTHEQHIIEQGESSTPGKPRAKRSPNASNVIEQAENPKVSLLKVLKSRGFEVSGTRDIFDPNAEIQYTTEKAIAPILEYVDFYNRNGKFELSLDDVLTLLKLPLNK